MMWFHPLSVKKSLLSIKKRFIICRKRQKKLNLPYDRVYCALLYRVNTKYNNLNN